MNILAEADEAADAELCRQVGEELNRLYPGHLWAVGCDHVAGTLHIKLPYGPAGIDTRGVGRYGYLLHIASLKSAADVRRRVMQAGGEILERYRLPRHRATFDSLARGRENGLDLTNAITKSRDAW